MYELLQVFEKLYKNNENVIESVSISIKLLNGIFFEKIINVRLLNITWLMIKRVFLIILRFANEKC